MNPVYLNGRVIGLVNGFSAVGDVGCHTEGVHTLEPRTGYFPAVFEMRGGTLHPAKSKPLPSLEALYKVEGGCYVSLIDD